MKKLLIAITVAMIASFSANAAFIQGVTGADMAGIRVAVTYANGDVETAPWLASSATAGGAFSFFTNGWTLTLDGDSFGSNTDVPDVFVGVWEFYSGAPGALPLITAISISVLDAGFVFDRFEGDNGDGSGAGRPFATDYQGVYAYGFSDAYAPGLYGTLTLYDEGDGIGPNVRFGMMTDTDAIVDDVVPTPAPAGIALLLLGFIGISLARRTN